jgi:hypothetical protein
MTCQCGLFELPKSQEPVTLVELQDGSKHSELVCIYIDKGSCDISVPCTIIEP